MIGCLTETTTCVVAKPLVFYYVARDNERFCLDFLFNSFYYGCYDKNAGKQTILYPSK